jgi:hypothetical protein
MSTFRADREVITIGGSRRYVDNNTEWDLELADRPQKIELDVTQEVHNDQSSIDKRLGRHGEPMTNDEA